MQCCALILSVSISLLLYYTMKTNFQWKIPLLKQGRRKERESLDSASHTLAPSPLVSSSVFVFRVTFTGIELNASEAYLVQQSLKSRVLVQVCVLFFRTVVPSTGLATLGLLRIPLMWRLSGTSMLQRKKTHSNINKENKIMKAPLTMYINAHHLGECTANTTVKPIMNPLCCKSHNTMEVLLGPRVGLAAVSNLYLYSVFLNEEETRPSGGKP